MRQFSLFLLIIIGVTGCKSVKNSNTENSSSLNGIWIPVQQQLGDYVLPETFFANQNLHISDTNYTVNAESVDKGILAYKNGKMDIYGKQGPNKGKHITAIYTFEDEKLKICYNLEGNSYPENYETKGKNLFFLAVYVREYVR